MKASHLGKLNNLSEFWRLDSSGSRSILGQRQVSSGLYVVIKVALEDLSQMALSQHDHVIQTFAPDGTHKSFCEGILPRTLRRDHYFLDPQPSDPNSTIVAVDSVGVSDQVAWNGVLQKGLDYLLPGPGYSRILRHVELNQPPPM